MGALIGPIIAGNVLEALGIERGWYTVVGVAVAFFLLPLPVIWYAYPATRNPWNKARRTKEEEGGGNIIVARANEQARSGE